MVERQIYETKGGLDHDRHGYSRHCCVNGFAEGIVVVDTAPAAGEILYHSRYQ